MIEYTVERNLLSKAEKSLDAGLDFLLRHQFNDALKNSANQGRFPHEYSITACELISYSVNWTTALAVEALMSAYQFKKQRKYYDAAELGINYLKSLQVFSPFHDNAGMILEETPQSTMCHPRDALTAALCMLDWSQLAQDDQAFQRVKLFADWFIKAAMKEGYPYWSVDLSGQKIAPDWFGSFHSGSAYFFCKLYAYVPDDRYLQAAQTILDHYNKMHLDADGCITVIRDRATLETLHGKCVSDFVPPNWELMHIYNDDFGALANLAAYNILGDKSYLNSAQCFIKGIVERRMSNGAFGDERGFVPSALGVMVMELFAARRMGFQWADDDLIDSLIDLTLDLQHLDKASPADGVFMESLDFNSRTNLRTLSYSLLALLKYLGAKDVIYTVV